MGNDYILISPGEHGAIDIMSTGPDAETGTEDDIHNWDNDKSHAKMAHQKGFTLLEVMLVMVIIARRQPALSLCKVTG